MLSKAAVCVMLLVISCNTIDAQYNYGSATIERQSMQRDARSGGYDYSYATSDGTSVEQSGVFNPETGVLAMFGSYEWRDPFTGQLYRVNYIADENGFQPIGDHIPLSAGVRTSRLGRTFQHHQYVISNLKTDRKFSLHKYYMPHIEEKIPLKFDRYENNSAKYVGPSCVICLLQEYN